MRTILILAANPKGTNRLRLDEEVKRIKQSLRRSNKREQFTVVDETAVTDDDLRRALLDNEPEVVHFAGHGTGVGQGGLGRDLVPAGDVDAGGLVFTDDVGYVHLISGDALARLFALCSDSVKCVVLNACYSEAQANVITKHIDFVVGMKKAIGDPAAIKFADGFYDALFAGRDFENAFEFGRNAIDLRGIPEHLIPILKKKVQGEVWSDMAVGIQRAVEARLANSVPRTSSVDRNADSGERDPSASAVELLDGPREDVRKAIRGKLERRLKQLKPEVLMDIVEELLEKDESGLEESGPPLSKILTTMMEPRSFGTIAGLVEIYDRLCEDSDWNQAQIVTEIIEEVTPLVIDDGIARQLWNAIHYRSSAFVAVPDRHSTTIEVLMARADGMGMKFKAPENEATVDDYEGTPLLQPARKLPVGAPATAESLARGILVDLCEGQSVRDSSARSATLGELIERLAGVLIANSRGNNRKRTLYCLHKMPTDPAERAMHEQAMMLVRDEFDKLKGGGSKVWEGSPRFVFLILAEESKLEGLRGTIVKMLKRRLKPGRKRTAYGARD